MSAKPARYYPFSPDVKPRPHVIEELKPAPCEHVVDWVRCDGVGRFLVREAAEDGTLIPYTRTYCGMHAWRYQLEREAWDAEHAPKDEMSEDELWKRVQQRSPQ